MGTENTDRCAICNAPAQTDHGRPGCGCAARPAEREELVAEAEDFHPLRVRPYVAGLSGDADEVPEARTAAPMPDLLAPAPDPADADAPDADADSEPYRVEPGRRSRRRGPVVVAAAVAATAVTAGAAVLAAQLLASSGPAERVLPDTESSAPRLVLPSGSGSASHSPSRGGSSSPSRSVTRSATAAATAPAARSDSATPSTTPSPRSSSSPSGPVLTMGDHGPEVVELQERLGQLLLYTGESDGRYSPEVRDSVSRYQSLYGVKGDPDGVYGTQTRASLESRTTEP